MADRRFENPRTFVQSWPERVGLPARLVNSLPPVVVLFGLDAKPAFGVAVLAALSGSTRAVLKMREFESAVDEALRDLGFRLDLPSSTQDPAERTAERVELLHGTLSAGQIDQLGILFEDYLRTTDEEWLEIVRRAARAVVKDAVDEGTRRTILARLSQLSLAHLRELARLRDRPDSVRPRLGVRSRDNSPLQATLLHIGMIREAPVGEATDAVPVGGPPRSYDPRAGEMEIRPTSLGLTALRLLGPIDVGSGR